MSALNISLLLYFLLDISFSILSLGFYHEYWIYEPQLITELLLLKDGYQFTTSPLDFLILVGFRLLVIIALLFVSYRSKDKKYWLTSFVSAAVVSYAFSLVKLLALSEVEIQLKYPGLWFSVGWSLIASATLGGLSYWFLARAHKNYEELLNEDDTEQGVSNNNTKGGTVKHAKKLLVYCLKEWDRITLGFICLLIYALSRVFIPAMMGDVISSIVKTKGYETLIRSVIIMSILAVISSIFAGLRGYCFMYTTEKINQDIRKDLFASLVKQDIAFFDVTKSGEIVSRLTSDCQAISSMISTNVNVFLRNGVMIIGAAAYMFSISWRLSMITLIAAPLISIVNKFFGHYFEKMSEDTQDSISKANHVAEEVLSSMRTVRSFACENQEVNRFSDKLQVTLDINKKKSTTYMVFMWNSELTDNAMRITVLFYGGMLVLKGLMSPDQLVTFLLYQMQLGENFMSVAWVFNQLMQSIGASKKVFELMERVPEIPMDGEHKPEVKGEIQFKDVHFTYPSRKNNPVLQGLSLTIPAGQILALVGPSGGGKSSIVSLLEHFYEPDSGEITLDGIPIKNIDHSFFHQKISLVAQEPVLYDGTIRENILYGCDWAVEEDMLKAAKMANVHGFVMELEKGYDTSCGEKGVQMSGGQKQRIAIARALVRNPVVLILDEATSALDTESEALVQEALNRCARERTVLIIAHRLSTIENADNIAVIRKGQVVQFGSHNDLMKDQDGLYYSLVSRQLLLEESK